jgi:5-methyltetrahydropteroyltriglutamate--homocysteine methyltransferase
MKSSTPGRILTTHVGSIPRPESIRELLRQRLAGQPVDQRDMDARVNAAVRDVVRQQAEAGIDIVADGELGKTSFISYTDERLNGFTIVSPDDPNTPASNTAGSWDRRITTRREWNAFREYYAAYLPVAMPAATAPVVCTGPVSYKGEALLKKELDTFKSALASVDVTEAFVPAIAPGMVGRGQNQYYKTEEEYRFAIAEALRTEYRAIVDAGFVLQIDDPGLGETWDMLIPAVSTEEYRRMQAINLEALNHALDGIPEDRVRYHLCWGSWQGPHENDLALRDIVDLVLSIKTQAYSIEAATPRHSYEWQVWQDVKLPDDKILIPGVIAHSTAVVEHPETIAERILNYVRLVGPERVIAGADCGFAQGALYERQHPSIMWAKFRAMAEGARLASQRL